MQKIFRRDYFARLRSLPLGQKFGVSDPLPPLLDASPYRARASRAAVPLCKGDNKPILPLEKGESRVAAGGRSHRIFCAKLVSATRNITNGSSVGMNGSEWALTGIAKIPVLSCCRLNALYSLEAGGNDASKNFNCSDSGRDVRVACSSSGRRWRTAWR